MPLFGRKKSVAKKAKAKKESEVKDAAIPEQQHPVSMAKLSPTESEPSAMLASQPKSAEDVRAPSQPLDAEDMLSAILSLGLETPAVEPVMPAYVKPTEASFERNQSDNTHLNQRRMSTKDIKYIPKVLCIICLITYIHGVFRQSLNLM